MRNEYREALLGSFQVLRLLSKEEDSSEELAEHLYWMHENHGVESLANMIVILAAGSLDTHQMMAEVNDMELDDFLNIMETHHIRG